MNVCGFAPFGYATRPHTFKMRTPPEFSESLLVGCNDQLWSIRARFARTHADGGGTEVGNAKTVGAIPGHIGSNIQADPDSAGEGTRCGQLDAQRRRIGVGGGQFSPGVVRDGPGADTRAVAVVREEQQAYLRDRSAQACDSEPYIGMHVRRTVHTHAGGASEIRACAGRINVGVGHRNKGCRSRGRSGGGR